MSFVLVVRMKAKEGEEGRAAELAGELAAASRQEAGCEAYVPCRDPEDAGSFLIYEQYRDASAAEAHRQSPHFKQYAVGGLYQKMRDRAREDRASEHFQRLAVGGLFELMESRERTFYETL